MATKIVNKKSLRHNRRGFYSFNPIFCNRTVLTIIQQQLQQRGASSAGVSVASSAGASAAAFSASSAAFFSANAFAFSAFTFFSASRRAFASAF